MVFGFWRWFPALPARMEHFTAGCTNHNRNTSGAGFRPGWDLDGQEEEARPWLAQMGYDF